LTSYEEHQDDPYIPRRTEDFISEVYDKPCTKEQLMSSDRSPLLCSNLKDLPPALMLVGGKDPLRDESILYAKLLREQSGEDAVKIHIYPSGFHGFGGAFPEAAASKKLEQDLRDGIAWLLSKAV